MNTAMTSTFATWEPLLPSLGPLRYRHVEAGQGGPISALAANRVAIGGKVWAQVRALLNVANPLHTSRLFLPAAGLGMHSSAAVARMIAISEALERWAFFSLAGKPEGDEFAFDCDPTTNGMAAFPGLFARQTRPYALAEAWERYLLASWWQGHIDLYPTDTLEPTIDSWAVQTPGMPLTFALLHEKQEDGFHAYGFATGKNYNAAWNKARLELARMAEAIRPHYQQNPSLDLEQIRTLSDPYDRRLLFFGYEAGYQLFLRRLSAHARHEWVKPEVLFDGNIPGPWQRFAHVWRVVFDLRRFDEIQPSSPYAFFW